MLVNCRVGVWGPRYAEEPMRRRSVSWCSSSSTGKLEQLGNLLGRGNEPGTRNVDVRSIECIFEPPNPRYTLVIR